MVFPLHFSLVKENTACCFAVKLQKTFSIQQDFIQLSDGIRVGRWWLNFLFVGELVLLGNIVYIRQKKNSPLMVLSYPSHPCPVQSPPSQRAWQRRRSSCWRSRASSQWTCRRRWLHDSSHSLWLPWLHCAKREFRQGIKQVFSSVESCIWVQITASQAESCAVIRSRCGTVINAINSLFALRESRKEMRLFFSLAGKRSHPHKAPLAGLWFCRSARVLIVEARAEEGNLTPAWNWKTT